MRAPIFFHLIHILKLYVCDKVPPSLTQVLPRLELFHHIWHNFYHATLAQFSLCLAYFHHLRVGVTSYAHFLKIVLSPPPRKGNIPPPKFLFPAFERERLILNKARDAQ